MKFIDSHHDRWHLAAGEDGPLPHPSPADQLLLTLEQWHAVRSHWSAQATAGKRLGLQLANDADVETLKADLPRLSPDTPLAAVTRYLAAYNLVCGPVLDDESHLLGAVTVDDVLDHLLPDDWRDTYEDPSAGRPAGVLGPA